MTLERFIDEIMASEDKNDFASGIEVQPQTKLNLRQYAKQINKKLRKDGRKHLIKYMKDKHYQALYNKSGYAKRKVKIRSDNKSTISRQELKIKKISVVRKGKTYQRTIQPRWVKTKILEDVSNLKPKSKEYNEYVKLIMESTGRTRQAVTKKIQRVRKAL